MTTLLSLDARRPALRVLPAPACEPPYDDELPDDVAPVPAVQGALALQLVTPRVASALPRHLHAVPDPAEDDFGPRPTPRVELPAPEVWARRLIVGVLEAVTGRRAVSQLARFTSDRVLAGLERSATRRTAAVKYPQVSAAVVRSVHVTEPRDGVAEVSAVVRSGGRCRAVAMRLEGLDGRWRCTALQLG